MKYNKIFRTLALAIILSLLVIAIPATPALAAREIDLDPDEGKIGKYFYVEGDGFPPSDYDVEPEEIFYVDIYFSSEEADTGDDIGDEVENYERLVRDEEVDDDGEFRVRVKVPDELEDGDEDEVVRGGTYYVYVTYADSDRIRAVAEFTVIAAEIALDTNEGPVGIEVKISGSDFVDREEITVEYDWEPVDIAFGERKTDRYGEFTLTIIIPESIAGDHTITVTDESDNEAEAEFTVESKIAISQTSGAVGDTVTVSGTGFIANTSTSITFDNVTIGTATTNANGSFSGSFLVPSRASGTYKAKASDGVNTDSADFTILISATLNPTTGDVSTQVTVSGTGFIVGGTVTITYDDIKVATATVKTDGTFSVTFPAPASKYGDHNITATDGTNIKQFTFTMESTPPAVPAPLLPPTGSQIEAEAEAYFDWKDVDDPSLPITYTLQIASDANFTTIVLEKEGLTSSEYTITEEEKLESVKKEAPYYWRVRAIDGASNEGKWSTPASFYVGFVFAMPSWAIYALFGFGALLLGVIGFYLGRRTAYYS